MFDDYLYEFEPRNREVDSCWICVHKDECKTPEEVWHMKCDSVYNSSEEEVINITHAAECKHYKRSDEYEI